MPRSLSPSRNSEGNIVLKPEIADSVIETHSIANTRRNSRQVTDVDREPVEKRFVEMIMKQEKRLAYKLKKAKAN